MRKYFKLFTILTVVFLFNCEEDESTSSDLRNHVSFGLDNYNYKIENGTTLTVDLVVAASEKSSSDRSYTILVDDASTLASAYSVPSTVTIPANSNVGTLSLDVTDDDNLGFEDQTLILDFQDEVGMSFGNAITLDFSELCEDNVVTLSITTDDWPDETSWELYDLSDTSAPIFSGGPFSNPADDFTTISIDFCLTSGMYGIIVYDSYGDGIVGGGYEVTLGGTSLTSGIVSGTYGSSTFTVD